MSHSARLRVAALLLIALPVSAQAQVGGLINKAKQAVADKTSKPAGSDEHIGDPFDDASLSAALKGMRTFKAKMSEVASIQAQYLANQKERSTLQEASTRVISEYETNRAKIHECQSAFRAANPIDNDALVQKKMMSLIGDQAAMQKFATESERLNKASMAAQAKGDTTAMKNATYEMMKLIGVDMAADSIAAARKCGALPARPAAMDQLDQMQRKSDDLNRQLRATESSSDIEAARAAGVTPARFGQMRERLTQFIDNGKVFGGKEGELLKSRKSEIEGLVKTP